MFVARTASSDGGRRIVLVGAAEVSTSAVFSALAAWDVEVVRSVERAPPAADAEASARKHAALNHADAVSWISVSQAGIATLIVVDMADGRVTTRSLDKAPPYDEATAAAIALTVKSVLRSTTLAPAAERTHRAEATTGTGAGVELEVGGGVSRSNVGTMEGRGDLGMSLWPTRVWGLGLRLSGGPGAEVSTPPLDGTLVNLGAALTARARVPAGRVSFTFELGPALQAVRLSATLRDLGSPVSVPRIDPAVEGGAAFDVEVGARTRVGVRALGNVLVRSQRFLIGGREALALEPLALQGALRFSVRLD